MVLHSSRFFIFEAISLILERCKIQVLCWENFEKIYHLMCGEIETTIALSLCSVNPSQANYWWLATSVKDILVLRSIAGETLLE